MTKELPSSDFLRKILRYEPETGKLFWRHRAPDTFNPSPKRSADDICANWNPQWAGKEAFAAVTKAGDRVGRINGQSYQAVDVVWAMNFDAWPIQSEKVVDHINCCRRDNRLENLRLVSRAQRSESRRRCSRSLALTWSVTWVAALRAWHALLFVRGRQIDLGYFPRYKDAVAARKQAAEEHRRWPDPNQICGNHFERL